MILTDLVQIRRLGELKRQENVRLRAWMKAHPIAERRLRRIAQHIEEQVDCTSCANCCRVATVRLRGREIETLARHLGVSLREFRQAYTEHSPEEGLILKRTPNGCIFLEGNLCSIYSVRPKTCQYFPHLSRGEGSLLSRMWAMADRACYCPIVYNTLEAFKALFGLAARK